MTHNEEQLMGKALEELQALRDWRATVTAALGREGGAFYEDVPKHIREMRREISSLKTQLDLATAHTRIDGTCD